MIKKFQSRRFLLAFASFILVIVQMFLPLEYRLNDTVVLGLIGIIMAYMGCDTFEHIKEGKNADTKKTIDK